MKKYTITVNGVSYEVAVQEQSADAAAPAAAVAAVAPAAAPVVKKPAPVAQPAAAADSDQGEPIVAPMPGTVLDVLVQVGQSVQKGDVLCILEAMKMENEIVSPRDGVVATVNTGKNTSVNAGDTLVSLQ